MLDLRAPGGLGLPGILAVATATLTLSVATAVSIGDGDSAAVAVAARWLLELNRTLSNNQLVAHARPNSVTEAHGSVRRRSRLRLSKQHLLGSAELRGCWASAAPSLILGVRRISSEQSSGHRPARQGHVVSRGMARNFERIGVVGRIIPAEETRSNHWRLTKSFTVRRSTTVLGR
jgi:hypothetical protein